jgi:gluconolactonase
MLKKLKSMGGIFHRIGMWIDEQQMPSGPMKSKSKVFKTLFPQNATLKRVSSGFHFIEGPVWCREERYLLFSDIPENKIYELTPDGRLTIFREPSGNSNGLTGDRQGCLIACEHRNRRVTRTNKDGSIIVIADLFDGKRLNSPNDVVVKSDGSVYFTDPPYGIAADKQEQPKQGVYRIFPDGKEIAMVVDDFEMPNGLAFSPDEKHLYIDDSSARHIRIFDVKNDGSLTNGRIFIDMNINEPGLPDGMKVDAAGHIFCTGPGGVWVINSDGKHLGTIITPEIAANCAWGGKDWKSLYITATTSIYVIRVNIPGIEVP